MGIHDGDTITVLRAPAQVRIRLVDINAPELGQDFGTRSRQSLSEICYRKPAEINARGKDRYGRVLAQVTCSGTNPNAEQVQRGMA